MANVITTIETVTWQQLDELCSAAGEAGDDDMVAIVERAMTPRDGEVYARGWAVHAVTADPAALLACVRAIAAGEDVAD